MKYRELTGYKYELKTQESCKVDLPDIDTKNLHRYIRLCNGLLTVEVDYAWDGASGPTIDDKTNMLPSLFHDALYQLMREGLLDRKYRLYADKLMRLHLLKCGMSRFRAWYYYQAVRIFAKRRSYPSKNPRGQIKEVKSLKSK